MRTLPTIRSLLALAAAGLVAGAVQAAEGLSAPPTSAWWPAWQARLSLTAPLMARNGQGLQLAPSAPVQQAALLGDWYLTGVGRPDGPSWRGGFRATGGLVMGHLGHAAGVNTAAWSASLLSATDVAPADTPMALRPYLGVGYAGMTADGGLSLSADLGLVADNPGALFGAQGLNDALRRLDVSPMLRVGVNYAF